MTPPARAAPFPLLPFPPIMHSTAKKLPLACLAAASLLTSPFSHLHAATTEKDALIAELRANEFNVRLVPGGEATEIGWGKKEWTPELWAKLPQIPDLTIVRGTTKFGDNAAMEVLTKLPKLQVIYLNAATFDDAGFAVLAKCKSLQSISLDHNFTINGSGAAALKDLPNLKHLRFGGCTKLTSAGPQACAQLTQLESLQIFHANATDEDVAGLTPLAGNLKAFVVASQFNGKLTEAALVHIAKLKNLESLKFGEVLVTYDNGLKHLTTLKNLKKLELDKIGASEEDINKLKAALPGCEIKWTQPSEAEVTRFKASLAKVRGKV